MAFGVHRSDDPAAVRRDADRFLASDPVRHHVVLTILDLRTRRPEPGRYWTVTDDDETVGVALQSPRGYFATITPMSPEAVDALVTAIVDHGVALPGVNGEAGTAAAFAGRWTELTRTGAEVEGQRIYEVTEVTMPVGVTGQGRRAETDDRDVVAALLAGFADETGALVGDTEAQADQGIAEGRLWVWERHDLPVALAGTSPAAGGVRRVGPVFTPARYRRCGYGSAITAEVSRAVLGGGERCILYTELANATSNGIYRAIGYRAVAEAPRYRFTGP
jgi:predicted GNAT family acetyltransferase